MAIQRMEVPNPVTSASESRRRPLDEAEILSTELAVAEGDLFVREGASDEHAVCTEMGLQPGVIHSPKVARKHMPSLCCIGHGPSAVTCQVTLKSICSYLDLPV